MGEDANALVEAEEDAVEEDMVRYCTGRTPGSDIGHRGQNAEQEK